MFYAIAITVSRVWEGVIIPFIWNLNTTKWENETRTWN